MKKISIVMLFLILTTLNIEAAENNGVQEVKTGLASVFSSDNDGDGIKDRDDLCKDTAVTPTHTDSNKDGCDDSTSALLTEITPSSTKSENSEVDSTKKETDTDEDGISDDLDGCVTYAPTIDNNENGCEDNNIRTMYIDSEADEDSFSITGIAFVDGHEFNTPNTYTTEVEFHNLTTGEYIPGKVATNYCDASINDSIIGTAENVSCSAFTVTFETSDFASLCGEETECTDSQKNDEVKYSVDITLTDQAGQKYTETLYSFDDFNGNNSGVIRIGAEESRVYLTIK